ncbi:MarR family transcriptional regulator [Collibacillus ludicampi]|uniref:MarR family transcriptional regulator n=1 Tax=Collibacillus ludicampi TaxID=2771369 RepID=A0AAV4LB69_9BACL|nr:MarR family transcriptional regulator [Collibacillus ludicampi]GIM45035.1 MarR family transcriptional regulator [Collibacillus ludicampi]
MIEHFDEYLDRFHAAYTETARKIGFELSKQLEAELGLTGPQFFILHLLSKKGRSMVSMLAEGMGVKPSAITTMIDRLYKSGLVSRERDDHDRRIVFVELSDKGQLVLSQAEQLRKQILGQFLARLKPEELRFLVNVYEKMAPIIKLEEENE